MLVWFGFNRHHMGFASNEGPRLAIGVSLQVRGRWVGMPTLPDITGRCRDTALADGKEKKAHRVSAPPPVG